MKTYEQKIAETKEREKRGIALPAGFCLGYLTMYAINQMVRWLPENPGTRELMDVGAGLIGAIAAYGWFRWGSERFLMWRFRRASRKINKGLYHG